jgi:hypothetical protein
MTTSKGSLIFCGKCGKSEWVHYDDTDNSLQCQKCGNVEIIGRPPGRFPFTDRDGKPVNKEIPVLTRETIDKKFFEVEHVCPYCIEEGKDGKYYTEYGVQRACCPDHYKHHRALTNKAWYDRHKKFRRIKRMQNAG